MIRSSASCIKRNTPDLEEGEDGCIIRVDGGDYAEVVLVFVEMLFRCGDGVIKRVGQGGVVGAKGEFGDLMGEVECCERG